MVHIFTYGFCINLLNPILQKLVKHELSDFGQKISMMIFFQFVSLSLRVVNYIFNGVPIPSSFLLNFMKFILGRYTGANILLNQKKHKAAYELDLTSKFCSVLYFAHD